MCSVQALYPALSSFPKGVSDYFMISTLRDPAHSWAFTVRSGLHSLVVEPSLYPYKAWLQISMHCCLAFLQFTRYTLLIAEKQGD
jgi:hypothetical protein